jgi:hypothetical protein
MNADRQWSPKHIDIEEAFDDFVPTFRNGQLIRELMPEKNKMPRNADYLFVADNVIAELKCLEKNPMEASDWPPRLAKAFMATGHSFDDLIGCLVRGDPMPDEVKSKLFNWLRDSIRSVVKTGNRQIRVSKRELRREGAKGLLLVANDNHYGFGPDEMIAIIGDAAALRHKVTSVRALAKALGRDYSNVHADVQALTAAGLLDATDGGVRADYDAIETKIAI